MSLETDSYVRLEWLWQKKIGFKSGESPESEIIAGCKNAENNVYSKSWFLLLCHFFEAVLPENQFHAEKFKSTVMAAPTMLQEVIF